MGNCVCGEKIYAKAWCRRCYEKNLPRKHITWNAKRRLKVERDRRYRASIRHESASMNGEDALDALCMAFNLEPLALARFILEQRDLHKHERSERRNAEKRVFRTGAFAPRAAARTGT